MSRLPLLKVHFVFALPCAGIGCSGNFERLCRLLRRAPAIPGRAAQRVAAGQKGRSQSAGVGIQGEAGLADQPRPRVSGRSVRGSPAIPGGAAQGVAPREECGGLVGLEMLQAVDLVVPEHAAEETRAARELHNLVLGLAQTLEGVLRQ